jgi:hypothetical protein
MVKQVLNSGYAMEKLKRVFKERSKAFVDFLETSGDIASPLESFLKGV